MLTARAAWIVLAILAAGRILAMASHSMWAWGLNPARFLDPAVGWIALGLLALAHLPPVAAALAPALASLGDLLSRSRTARLCVAALAALLVWELADRLWFLGDFMLRQGAAQGESIGTMFEQALPLDLILHGLGPRSFPTDPVNGSVFSRLLGAAEAGMLAWLALRFARGLALTGAAALAAVAVVFFGGHLALFTGFAKATSELALLTVATVVFGASLARGGRGGYALGLVLALAFALHRAALMLVPAWLLACGIWYQRHRSGSHRLGGLVATVLPAMMLVRALPEMIRIARTFDLTRHVFTPEVAAAGGPLRAAFEPIRLIDLANLGLILAPVGLIGLLWLASSSRRGSVELALLATLSLAALPLLLFIHPQQGIFRDWDVFSPAGTVFCMLGALAIGVTIQEQKAAWLTAPALASVAVPTLLVLFLHHDVDQGLRRVRAFAAESPGRVESEQAAVWDFLGIRSFRLARWDLAVEAFAHCDRFEPTRRVRLTWAISETMRGNYAGAEAVYSKIVRADPADPIAWLGLGGAAKRMGDEATFRRAAEKIDRFMRVEASKQEITRYLSYFPQAWPADSVGVDSLR